MALTAAQREYQKAYRERNREALAARARERYQANREERIAKQKAYTEANRDAVLAYKQEWWARNREAQTERKRQRWAEQRDVIADRRRAEYEQQPGPQKARSREYYHANKHRLRAATARRVRRWAEANKHKRNEGFARRRAAKKATQVERIDFAAVLRDSGGVCGICRKPLDLFGTEFDHIIPLARGGTHTRENIQVSHAYCNRSKGARL
jgi:5-methylcytosine-specific restriction endonuclease McrA